MVVAASEPGRRARKKAQTRASIAQAALTLFLERGFDEVTTAEVAEAADVSVATLFNHFATKEALVLDEDTEREQRLVAAVQDRDPGTSLVDALHRHFARLLEQDNRDGGEVLRSLQELVQSTPSLRDFAQRMWTRHENSLAEAIAADHGAPTSDPAPRALAHLIIEAQAMANVPGVDPRAGLDAAFDIVRRGWDISPRHRREPRTS